MISKLERVRAMYSRLTCRGHIAAVTNAQNQVVGIITLEDVVEELIQVKNYDFQNKLTLLFRKKLSMKQMFMWISRGGYE